MFFAKDSNETAEVVPELVPTRAQYGAMVAKKQGYYNFPMVQYLTEEEAIQYFKQKFNYYVFFPNKKGETPPVDNKTFNIGHIDLYMFPKVFDKWFPFLDCDNDLQYQSCVGTLTNENIPHVVYTSSEKEYKKWVFCDVESSFDNAIKFIESHPADPAYAFCAKHRGHLCIRAYPKKGIIPTRIDAHLEDNFSNRFKFWLDEFDNYWNNGEIVKYTEYLKIINNI